MIIHEPLIGYRDGKQVEHMAAELDDGAKVMVVLTREEEPSHSRHRERTPFIEDVRCHRAE